LRVSAAIRALSLGGSFTDVVLVAIAQTLSYRW
jgi:hypothetical protein